jgi:hypothetical protein
MYVRVGPSASPHATLRLLTQLATRPARGADLEAAIRHGTDLRGTRRHGAGRQAMLAVDGSSVAAPVKLGARRHGKLFGSVEVLGRRDHAHYRRSQLARADGIAAHVHSISHSAAADNSPKFAAGPVVNRNITTGSEEPSDLTRDEATCARRSDADLNAGRCAIDIFDH